MVFSLNAVLLKRLAIFFFYFILSFTTSHLQCPRPPSLPVPPQSPSGLTPQTTPPLFLYRKGQVSHEYHQNTAYQIEVRLSPLPCIKAGQGHPIQGVGFQRPMKESEIAPGPNVRHPTNHGWTNLHN